MALFSFTLLNNSVPRSKKKKKKKGEISTILGKKERVVAT